MILEPKKIKSVIDSTFPLSIFHEVLGPDVMILVVESLVSSQLFHSLQETLEKEMATQCSIRVWQTLWTV